MDNINLTKKKQNKKQEVRNYFFADFFIVRLFFIYFDFCLISEFFLFLCFFFNINILNVLKN